MLYSKITLVSIVFISCWTYLYCDAKPLKKQSKGTNSKKSFINILNEKTTFKCDEILNNEMDLKKFTDEIAFSFLNTGNVAALDNILKYLVNMECFTEEQTNTFRSQLVKIYDLISKDTTKGALEKRGAKKLDYFGQVNYLVDELIYAYNTENAEEADEMLKYMVEYILALEDSHDLTTRQSNILLGKIKDAILQRRNNLQNDRVENVVANNGKEHVQYSA